MGGVGTMETKGVAWDLVGGDGGTVVAVATTSMKTTVDGKVILRRIGAVRRHRIIIMEKWKIKCPDIPRMGHDHKERRQTFTTERTIRDTLLQKNKIRTPTMGRKFFTRIRPHLHHNHNKIKISGEVIEIMPTLIWDIPSVLQYL